MSNIFSNSDTIFFGDKKNSASQDEVITPKNKKPVKIIEGGKTREKPVSHTSIIPEKTHQEDPIKLQMEPNTLQNSLSGLLVNMKKTFLPRLENPTTRMVFLSPASVQDPMTFLSYDENSFLIGSGIQNFTKWGQEYTGFPDIRLVFSEKSRLRAWILLDENIDPKAIFPILSVLDFPPIYTTRTLIAKFRETLSSEKDLEKCRFFELFSDGDSIRNIAGFDFGINNNHLAVRGHGSVFILPYEVTHSGQSLETNNIFTAGNENYTFWDMTISEGEILVVEKEKFSKDTFKFSLDTFFYDKNSVGVQAGFTLADRQTLSEHGVLIFTLTEDSRARSIAGHIFIESRGFVHSHETMQVHKEILKAIRLNYEQIIEKNPRIDRGNLAQLLKREIAKYCFILTGHTPVVMPIIL